MHVLRIPLIVFLTSVALAGCGKTDVDDVSPSSVNQGTRISGAVQNLTGSSGGFQFTVGGTLVRGDASTAFRDPSGQVATFAALHNGDTVDVTGSQDGSGFRATRIDVTASGSAADTSPSPSPSPGPSPSPAPSPAPSPSPSPSPAPAPSGPAVTGTIGTLAGACPNLVFTVGANLVVTNQTTTFGGGQCSGLKIGDVVTASGTVQADGSIVASQVTRQ